MNALLPDLAEQIRELTHGYTHREPLHDGTNRWAITRHPPLLTQLRDAAGGTGNQPTRSSGASDTRLPVNPDALDTYHRITRAAARWAGRQPRTHLALLAAVATLTGHAATLDPDPRKQLAADVDTWHTWCREHTGWTLPAWRPAAPCPRCGELAGNIDGHPVGLRVARDLQSARCVTDACDGRWDANTIGILFQHLADHFARHGAAA